MSTMKWRRLKLAFAAVAASTIALTACSSPNAGDPAQAAVSKDDIDKAMSTETTITFWSWVSDIEDEVALFEKKYPAITVDVVDVGSGADYYTKLRSAIEAGSGAPDVAQIELHHLPSFILKNSLLDLSAYGAADIADTFEPYAWGQVTIGDAVYAIPQDTGPMGLLYRQDLLSAAGLEAPTTWDDFATAAAAYRAANPTSYLANVSPSNWTPLVGLFQQAGATPFGYDGQETVTIDVDSPEAQSVVAYWQNLIQQDLVSTDPDFTDSWYQGLANGKYASWVTAAWGPLFLEGTAENTAGSWRASELPQWDSGAHASGVMGGASNAVIASSEHPIPAAMLAQFLSGDEASSMQLANQQHLFPALSATLQSPEFTDQEVPFFGGQKVNELFAGISSQLDQDITWLPFMDYVGQTFNDTLGKAIANHDDLSSALTEWNEQLVEYAKSQGFTVE